MQALMPRGRVWPKDADATQTQVLSGLVQVYARNTARANNLLVDAFPGKSAELLPEWEATLGLPDPCAGIAPTVAQRNAQVLARFTGVGGQSAAYYISYAATLGYVITITEFAPARVGQSRVGQPLCGPPWAFAWQINAPLNTITQSRAGTARAGDPLASWGNAVLQCEITEIIPAHTIPIFAYS
ncbi:YmfQ family protein [Paraburkholderia aspalathi]|nr:putative phage tail protein [Paraburkholderia aspalathi]